MRTRIKICCVKSIQEAKIAIESGADAIGLVARMPSGPGPIPDDLIKEIAQSVPPFIGTFLLTSETSAADIIKHHHRTQTNTIQIVDMLSKGTYTQIKKALPNVRIVQVIHVSGPESVVQAIQISEHVNALLLDSGNPNLKIKELGGTGRVHNWTLSRQIREFAKCPVILAGGLNPGNVKQAITEVKPFAVDVCTGIRSDGALDKEKLSAFVKNVCSGL
ncbi:MAG: phosphoribosylanthranilate isomerase [Bacteroidales bacterium]|jgi:phosphoribosylanthranilate isomerase